MEDSLIIKVLKEIEESGAEGVSFLELLEKLLDKNKPENWIKLRVILTALVEDMLIEERHGLDGDEKRVDYSINQKGIEFLEKLK